MRILTRAQRSTSVGENRPFIWVIGLAIGLLSCPVLGQVDVNEPGLHDSEIVYGIDGSSYTNPWINSQTISLFGWGETDPNLYANVYFYAYGIFSEPNAANSGSIDVTATGGAAYVTDMNAADAGYYAAGFYANGDANNTGAIHVTGVGGTADAMNSYAFAAGELYGISAFGSILNSADITVLGTSGTAYSAAGTADTYMRAYGIYSEADVDNSGNVTVSGTGGNATSESTSNYAYAYADVYGISGYGDVANSGSITATAAGGVATSNGTGTYYAVASAGAEAWGITTYGNIDNLGQLTVSAIGGEATTEGSPASAYAQAHGLYDLNGDVNNAGDLTITATAGTADANEGSASAYAYAAGIQAYGNVTNSGDIAVTALAGTTNGSSVSANAEAYGIHTSNGDVVNSGDITVSATETGLISYAYGIYMSGSGYLTNTGIVRATGDLAYELYVDSGGVTLLDTYNVTLDGDPNQASIYVGNEGMLALNGATLTVTGISGETLWDTEYSLFEAHGNVSGDFNDVQAVNPSATATYYDQGTESAEDDTVSLSYAPSASTALASSAAEKQMVSHAARAISRHMTSILLESMLEPDVWDSSSDPNSSGEAALGGSACQRASGMFIEPYYSHVSKDSNPLGYKGGLWGSSIGYSQCMGNSLLGLHVGFGQSDIDYTGTGYSANSEDQGVVTAGFSGMTRWRPWALSYGLTSFHAWHDYEGLTGWSLNERETASYDSYGGTASVALGRTFQRGKHVFYPEVGATYLWTHRQRYTTDASDSSWDTTYSAMNDHDVVGEASLYWQSRFMHGKTRITPSASIGIRQLLTDGETEVWQSVEGADRVQVTSEQDQTAVALAGSLVLRKSRTTLTFSYDGEYSSDIQEHNVWMRVKWQF